MTREQLIQKKEQLLQSLDEIQENLNKFNKIVYGGKLKKSIELLKEVLDYLSYPTISIECEECWRYNEVDLDEIIDGLENLYREEFNG